MIDERDDRLVPEQGRRDVLGRGLAAVLLPLMLAACTAIKVDPFPEPLRPPLEDPEDAVAPEITEPATELRTSPTPGVVLQRSLAEGAADRLGEQLSGPPIEVSFHDLPLVTFINEVFGERLGMSFVVAPGLSDIAELITLRLTEPISPRRLFDVARNVLSEYGVALRADDGVITFAPSEDAATGDTPADHQRRPDVAARAGLPSHHLPFRAAAGSAVRRLRT